tara:strand:- start:4586 stop:4801 length:216 start_codon:yes stop_codon:yes gene_type:complete
MKTIDCIKPTFTCFSLMGKSQHTINVLLKMLLKSYLVTFKKYVRFSQLEKLEYLSQLFKQIGDADAKNKNN